MSSPKSISLLSSSYPQRKSHDIYSRTIPDSAARKPLLCHADVVLPKFLGIMKVQQVFEDPEAAVLERKDGRTAVPTSHFESHFGLKQEALSTVSSIPSQNPISGSDLSLEVENDGIDEIDEIERVDETSVLLCKSKTTDLRGGEPVQDEGPPAIDDEEKGKTRFLGGISRRQFYLLFVSIMLAALVAAFDATIMASSHTSVTSSFNSSNSASWLSTSYLLTSTAIQPLFARVSDSIGRKIPYIFAISVFTAGTLWCALAQNMESLIFARAVCGVGCGGMVTMGSVVLSDLVPIQRRGVYQGMISLCFGLGNMLGAGLGGLLADALGWRMEFGIQIPVGILCIAVANFTIPSMKQLDRKKSPGSLEKKPFDYAGSIVLVISSTLFILSLNTGGNIYPWVSFQVLFPLLASLILFRFFLNIESKAASPIMPLKMFWTSSPHRKLVFSNFFGSMTIAAVVFNLPLYFQAVKLESATIAGTRILVATASSTIGAALSGFLVTRTGKLQPTVVAGALLLMVGPILLVFMQQESPNVFYLLSIIPNGLGIGISSPSALMSVLAVSSQADQAVASSTLFMFRSLGSVLGISSSSTIVQNSLLYYLTQYFPQDKMDVIEQVRKSVRAVFDLEGKEQELVVKAYIHCMRWCFLWTAVSGVLGLVVLWGLKLPSLDAVEKYREERRREEGGLSEEHQDENAEE